MRSVSDRNIKTVTWVFGLSTWVTGDTICSDGKHCGQEGLGVERDIRATLLGVMHLRRLLDLPVVLLSGMVALETQTREEGSGLGV